MHLIYLHLLAAEEMLQKTLCLYSDREDVKAIFQTMKALNWTTNDTTALEQSVREWRFDDALRLVFDKIVNIPNAVGVGLYEYEYEYKLN